VKKIQAAGVVGEQKSQSRLRQHVLVHGDTLMRQRIDERYLGRESRIEEVPERQSFGFGEEADTVGGREKVSPGCCGGGVQVAIRAVGRPSCPCQAISFKTQQLLPSERARLCLAVLPSVHGGERNAEGLRELDLRQAQLLAQPTNPALKRGINRLVAYRTHHTCAS
jgi:hypothetical protein